MRFVDHRNLEGKHAFLGASKSSWLRYDDDKVLKTYRNARAAAIGTQLHEIAAEHIRLGLPSVTQLILSVCSSTTPSDIQ